MRMSVTGNNNGACCDKCGKLLLSAEVTKIKSQTLDLRDSTGRYKTKKLCDLCSDCYRDLLAYLNIKED